jgi:hypothetical protein
MHSHGMEDQMSQSFPPKTVEEVMGLDAYECYEGFASYEANGPEPGENRSVAFRWGWWCRHGDHTGEDPLNLRFLRRAVVEHVRAELEEKRAK